jgi:putative transposase
VPDYRRNRVAGGSYFFTVNLLDRNSDLLTSEVAVLREAVRKTRTLRPFHIDAWVALPEHLHCLWTLPPGDTDFPLRWQMIKASFSRAVGHSEERRPSLVRKREAGIWQRRYWEHTIRDEPDYAAHMDYIHFNPVKHGLAQHPAEWPFSSFARCVRQGLYPADWAIKEVALADAGERAESEVVG